MSWQQLIGTIILGAGSTALVWKGISKFHSEMNHASYIEAEKEMKFNIEMLRLRPRNAQEIEAHKNAIHYQINNWPGGLWKSEKESLIKEANQRIEEIQVNN